MNAHEHTAHTHLCVYKQEGDLLVGQAGLQHDALDVLPPLGLTIVLRQFNLETRIIRAEGQTHTHTHTNTQTHTKPQ